MTFYFPLYLTSLTERNLSLGLSTSGAMVLAGLAVPWLGALSDRTGKTKRYLIVATLLYASFVFCLSLFREVPMLIAAFLLSCFFYHAALVFYCALLPVVAEPKRQGSASGLGTALGYLGVLFAVPIAHFIDSFFERRFVFAVAGLLVLIFSIPLILWVPERRVTNPLPVTLGLLGEEWRKVFKTLTSLKGRAEALFFFLGNLFVMEAVNTVIFWLVVYMDRVFGPPRLSLMLTFLALNFSAFLFGLAAGFLTDRYGSQKILLASAGAFFITLFALGWARSFPLFVGFSLTGGAFGFAGIGTAARKWVVELAPSQSVGEYFGLYNLTAKVSVAGSLIFSIVADRIGFHAALLAGTVPSGVGLFFLWLAYQASRRNASRYPAS